jgi:PAS domain S-box-containing protein
MDSNKAMSNVIGYSKAEIKGLSYDDITPEEYAAEDKRQGEILKSKGVFGPYSKEYIHKDGHRVKVIITGFSTEHPEHGLQVWTHIMDLSEIEAKTEALKKSEARFKSYVENASDMIFTIDAEGLFTYISPNVEKIFGFKPDEVLHTNVMDYVHPDEVLQTQAKYDAGMINSTEPFRLTLRIRHKDGHYKYLEADGSMQLSKVDGIYGIIVARDIDEKQKSKLQILDQNARLKDIAFVQSHILRKPMVNILGILNQDGLDEGESEESKKLHKLLKEQVVLMDGIVKRIVDKSTKIREMK